MKQKDEGRSDAAAPTSGREVALLRLKSLYLLVNLVPVTCANDFRVSLVSF